MHEQARQEKELPRYRSHKLVWALKIHSIERPEDGGANGAAVIVPDDQGYGPFRVDGVYMGRHNPQPGGYYVVYEDGYKSYSPAEPFESGYTLIR